MTGGPEIAAAIRHVLDRNGDVFERFPEFVREHLVARLNVNASNEVARYAGRLSDDLLSRGALATQIGMLLRDEACLKVFVGHEGSIVHIAALPDGRAISASYDHTLRLWDLASGQCLRVLEGHSDSVRHVAALPDGRAISASYDKTLRHWDLASGQCLRSPRRTFRSRRPCRGAARRTRDLRLSRPHPAALGPRLRQMPARPRRTCPLGRPRRGAARRTGDLRLSRPHPAALGPRLRPMPARPRRTFRSRHPRRGAARRTRDLRFPR